MQRKQKEKYTVGNQHKKESAIKKKGKEIESQLYRKRNMTRLHKWYDDIIAIRYFLSNNNTLM